MDKADYNANDLLECFNDIYNTLISNYDNNYICIKKTKYVKK